MSKIEDIIKKINSFNFPSEVKKIDMNLPDGQEKYQNLLNNFVSNVEDMIVSEDISVIVTILDLFYNVYPIINLELLKRRNPKILDAQLVLEKIKGIDASTIKDEKENAKSLSNLLLMNNQPNFNSKNMSIMDISSEFYDILNEYLQSINEPNEKQEKDTINFYSKIEYVNTFIVSVNTSKFFPPRESFVKTLFALENASDELLSKVFNEVFEINRLLQTYDYEDIIYNDVSLLLRVKGLFKKCNDEFFNILASASLKKIDYDKFKEYLLGIITLNKDDEKGLNWFFQKFNIKLSNNPKLKKYLNNQDFFQKYCTKDITELCNDNIDKFLNGDKNIDDVVIEVIGKERKFINNFDILLKKYCESKDDEFKKKLIFPLIVALIEKQKEKYHLDFNYVFNSRLISGSVWGYYSNDNNIMYINPKMLENITDMNDALVEAFDTIFHETRHACQNQEVTTLKMFSFDNLIMAIDLFMSNRPYSNYYNENYEHISYEKDAREMAYVDCMTIFRNQEEMQKRVKKEYNDKYRLSDYMRKKNAFSIDVYHGIIEMFQEEVNSMFEVFKEDKNCDKEIIKKYLESIKKYPVILEFFDLDEKKLVIKAKSNAYLYDKLNKIKEMPEGFEKREQIYSMKAFLYALRVSNYIVKNPKYSEKLKDSMYDMNIVEEIENEIGKGPTR